MADYLTIDGGTTNTRIALVRENQITDRMKLHVGARKGMEDGNLLRETVKEGISEMLRRNGMETGEITRILASGMITSEFGLVNLPHMTAPVGVKELHETMYETVLEDISPIPFVFIRGVKTETEELESTDMMRGEETEMAGLWMGEGVYILSGSHSKIIKTDEKGRIVAFKTMLTGEMIAALAEHTILKSTVELKKQAVHGEFLRKGYEYARKNGINDGLFKVRVLKNIFGRDAGEVYNFFMGVILCDEVEHVLGQKPERICVSGQTQIKEALTALLGQLTDTPVVMVGDQQSENATAVGAIRIFEYAP